MGSELTASTGSDELVERKWKRGTFPIKTRRGFAEGVHDRLVKGHTDGTFGLDRRRYWDDDLNDRHGYVITHLRTGHVVRHVKGNLSAAKRLVEILHAAPWDFDDVEKCKEEGRAEAVIAANATGLCGQHYDFMAPVFVDEVSSGWRKESGR